MTPEACKEAVCSGDPGDFLVRDSSDGKNMVIVLNDHGKPANFHVVKTPDFQSVTSTTPDCLNGVKPHLVPFAAPLYTPRFPPAISNCHRLQFK
jgi:hypothetical protein